MSASRRDDLVDAAMRVFCRHGFHSTGIEQVLAESGVSRMTLYNHFKSKDELIVAAMRRRDETFRNRLMKYVESRASDPVARILAVFDFHEQWFAGPDFHGCMFINASAEFSDTNCAIRKEAARHKSALLDYLRELCKAARRKNPDDLAHQLNLLLEGATVTALVVGQVGLEGAVPADAARRARETASILIDAASEA